VQRRLKMVIEKEKVHEEEQMSKESEVG